MTSEVRGGRSQQGAARTASRSVLDVRSEPIHDVARSTHPPLPGTPLIALPAYERDPSLTHLETSVVECGIQDGRPFAVLADTVLYPEGGGQPSDRGTIAGVPVVDVQKVEGQVRHVLADPVEPGPVTVELDWTRRFDHMQQHTAQHLLTAVAADRFGWQTTAFHLGERVSDVELDVASIDPEQLQMLEDAVAAEVRAACPVTAFRVSHEDYEQLEVRSRGLPAGHSGDVRLVEIEGIDLNTCGGTHCASTAELETVKLLGTESLRGGTRVFYLAGERLRRRLGSEVARTAALRGVLGVSDDELVGGVESRLDQVKDAGRTIRRLEERLTSLLAERFVASPEAISVEHLAGHGLPFLQRIAREVEALDPTRAVFLTAGEGEEGFFLLAAGADSTLDVPELGPRIAEVLEGKGGGKGRVFQGRVRRLSRRGEAALLLR